MHKKHKTLKQHYKLLETNPYILKFGRLVHAQNLWSFNRRSLILGITIGIMCGWIPMPFHTTIAIALAILVDCNIPLATLSIWVANPLTMPFMYYVAYRLGEALLHRRPSHFDLYPSIDDLMAIIDKIWQPLLLGCLVCSIFCGIVVYTALNLCWNTQWVQKLWKKLRHD